MQTLSEFTSPPLFTCLVSPFFAFLFHFPFSSLSSALLSIFLLIKEHYMIQVKTHHHHINWFNIIKYNHVALSSSLSRAAGDAKACSSPPLFLSHSFQDKRIFILTIKLPISEHKQKDYFLFPSPFPQYYILPM